MFYGFQMASEYWPVALSALSRSNQTHIKANRICIYSKTLTRQQNVNANPWHNVWTNRVNCFSFNGYTAHNANGTTWVSCKWCHISLVYWGEKEWIVRLNFMRVTHSARLCYIFLHSIVCSYVYVYGNGLCRHFGLSLSWAKDTCCELFNLHNNLINFPRAKTKRKVIWAEQFNHWCARWFWYVYFIIRCR